jgi:beta-glucosidase
MHKPRFKTACDVALLCATVLFQTSCSTRAESDAVAEPRPLQRAVENYSKKHQRFVQTAKEGNIDLLFIGDSITEYWLSDGKSVWDSEFSKWRTANFGISGDTTYGVRARLDEELVGISPKVIVLLIGTNDLSHGETPERIAANTEEIVKTIKRRLPATKILVLGILPRGQARDGVRAAIAKVNELTSKLDNGRDVKFLDIGNSFVDKTGEVPLEIMPDLLHLSNKGYKIWADSVRDYLIEWFD